MRPEDDPRGYPAMDVVIAKLRKNKEHKRCPRKLKSIMAAIGIEITVSTCRPLVCGPYTTDPHICPHGVVFWIEPTSEQIAKWAADNTP